MLYLGITLILLGVLLGRATITALDSDRFDRLHPERKLNISFLLFGLCVVFIVLGAAATGWGIAVRVWP